MSDTAQRDIEEAQGLITHVEDIHNRTAKGVAQAYKEATGERRTVEEFKPPHIEGQGLDLEKMGIMLSQSNDPSYAETIAKKDSGMSGLMEDITHNLLPAQNNIRVVPGNEPNFWAGQRTKRLKFAKKI